MKRFSILFLALLLGFGSYAQKKPKINKANTAREKGELAEAKEIIDLAIEHEKTKDDGKTWYYRGLIYATIDTTSNPEYSALSDNALEEAMEAFNKADELGEEGKEYYTTGEFGLPTTKTQQLDNYFTYYYNQGVAGFQEDDFEAAAEGFEKSQLILPDDTNSYVNAAYAAHNGEMFERAKENYRKALDKGAIAKDLYYNYVNILIAVDKDKEAALKLAEEGLEKYPNDPVLSKNKINLLIELGRIDEARDDLEKAIETEPDNEALYFTLGVLHEELGNPDKALDAYNKALGINPDHFESSFNKGVLLIYKANEVIKERNNLGVSRADQKRARELDPIINEKLKEALPQWEKTVEINPNDKQSLETLSYIYTQLRMDDKAAEIEKRLENL